MVKRIRLMLCLIFAGSILLAQSTSDRWIGTWKLNVEKSQPESPNRPAPQVIKLEAISGGMRVTQNVGTPNEAQFSAHYDEKDIAINPAAPSNTVALKRVDAYTFQATMKNDGQVRATHTVVVSRDGKTLTQTQVTGNVKTVSIYDKVQ